MAGFDPDAYLAQKPSAPVAFDPDAYLNATSTSGIPKGRRSALGDFGASAASLADVTVGGVLPLLGQVVQPIVRPFTTAKRAEEIGGAVSSALDKPFGKAFGVTESPAYQSEASRQLMDFIGANVGKGADWISGKTGLPVEDVRNMLGTSLVAAPAAVRGTVGGVKAAKPVIEKGISAVAETPVGQVIQKPFAERAARIQEQRVAESYKNATAIDAAKAAQRQGIALNPAESNPTVANKARSIVAGTTDLDARLAKNNEVVITEKVRKDLGVPAERKLDASAIESALDEAAKAYDPIRKMESLTVPKKSIDALESLRKQAPIGGETETAAINSLVDDALFKLQKTKSGPFSGVGGAPVPVGRSGAAILDDIRVMRRDAQAVYKAEKTNPDPLAKAKADAQMSIAGILEDVIDANAPTPQILSNFQKARTRMAQIYDHGRALDYGTNKVDPQVYAKMYDERKGNMTGVGADIGLVASNFPSVTTAGKQVAEIKQRLTRSGVGGTMGFIVGGVPGAAVGAGAGYLASAASAKRMMTPAYQAARAVPKDYRPPVNMLRPIEPNATPNALVPYDYSQQIIMPEQVPNWRFGQGEQPTPVVTPGMPQMPPQLGAPSAESTLAGVQQRRAFDYNMQRALEEQQAQAAAAQAATNRKPARGGVQFELDPVTGELRELSSTLKGATPDVQVIESTGKSLQSASEKLSSGKSPALLSSEERIAWNKTKVDLAEADPGLKGLSDKAIANKMMDRQWIDETINKLREQDRIFNELAQRSAANRIASDAANQAALKREQMLTRLMELQDQLSTARPVSSGVQGPKTRAFQRNRLAAERENQNALAGK